MLKAGVRLGKASKRKDVGSRIGSRVWGAEAGEGSGDWLNPKPGSLDWPIFYCVFLVFNPRGSKDTAIMELGPKRPSSLWFWGPNSIIAVYMDPLGI